MNDLVTNRDAVARAAAIFDEHARTINDQQDKLNNAIAELEARRMRIEQLEFSLAEERSRCTALQNERDIAVLERSEVSVMFYNMKAQLDAFVVALPPLPRKIKRNGKGVEGTKGEGAGHYKEDTDEARTADDKEILMKAGEHIDDQQPTQIGGGGGG